MTSEYMNNLYRDLLSNSPQTVTIPIPSDMGTGQIAQVVTKQGAVVSDWKMNYFSDMNVRGINSEDYIQMLFCLNDGVSWNIAGSREGACLAKGESCIYRGHGKMESLCYAQNSDFYFKNIKIPVPYFKRLLQDRNFKGEHNALYGAYFRRVTRLYTLSGWAWVSVSGKQNPRIAVSIFERSVGAANPLAGILLHIKK